MLLIIFVALEKTWPSSGPYGPLVLAGLSLSFCGDVLLMLPGERYKQGLLFFLAAHIVFGLAFLQETRFVSWPVLIALLGFGSLFYLWLHGSLHGLRLPVLIYIFVISLMAWLAVNRYLNYHDFKSLFTLLGGLLFLASDSIWAANKFKKKFQLAEILILGSYFTGQLFFALSI